VAKNVEASDLYDSDLPAGVTVGQFEAWKINLT
jgi:hypothetical protein